MKPIKPAKILEITWLILACIIFLLAIQSSFIEGFVKSRTLYLLALVSFLMYLLRRNSRKKRHSD